MNNMGDFKLAEAIFTKINSETNKMITTIITIIFCSNNIDMNELTHNKKYGHHLFFPIKIVVKGFNGDTGDFSPYGRPTVVANEMTLGSTTYSLNINLINTLLDDLRRYKFYGSVTNMYFGSILNTTQFHPEKICGTKSVFNIKTSYNKELDSNMLNITGSINMETAYDTFSIEVMDRDMFEKKFKKILDSIKED